MWPIRDINPTEKRPIITEVLIFINFVFFIPIFLALYVYGDPVLYEELIYTLGLVPEDLLAGRKLYTIFTSMFTHADIFHIIGNMVFLHIFGDNVEDKMGRLAYLLFYFACGLGALALHITVCLFTGGLDVPVVGASGAISGVLGAYVVMFPKARILTAIIGYGYTTVAIRAEYYIGFWFVYQLIWALLSPFIGSMVAYWAHIGGFITGLVLGLLARYLLRPEVLRGAPGW